jgi:hypothetical protein
LAIKPLKPSKQKRKSLDQMAKDWVNKWRQEEARRRLAEQRLGHLTWRHNQQMDPANLEPLLREKVLKLLA